MPDLAVGSGAYTVANAQHAVRQGKHLARNIAAALRGRRVRDYRHRNLGVVATLGLGHGVFESGPFVVHGLLAWLMHRGYHLLAVPSLGAQGARAGQLAARAAVRPRHRVARVGAAPPRRVRRERRGAVTSRRPAAPSGSTGSTGWSAVFGVMSAGCFAVLLLTGVVLMVWYEPSSATVRYRGAYLPLRDVEVSRAFNSVLHLSLEVRGGLLVRQAHHWAALLLPATLTLCC
ncbi:hypothetical protein GCM10025868_22200 [Angustibacter aerolatus]|uniref:Cytochrome bc1 complex cytochrome b subunit n=1 Tax=Angustibacter aerolatus TaxID=1162965 RepID=A0ABQ6JFK9_9ACTN|nr:hypothetical protein GCM10025868_22200 [Angustibacter aerolatus]